MIAGGDTVKTYLVNFLFVTVGVSVFYYSLNANAMPWWPDALIIGLPFGLVATLGAWQHHRTNRMIWNALRGAIRRRRVSRDRFHADPSA